MRRRAAGGEDLAPVRPPSRAGTWLRERAPRLAGDLAINFVAPLLIYDRLHGPWGDTRTLLSRGPADRQAAYEARRHEPGVRRHEPGVRRVIKRMTLVWGFGLLADVAVSAVLIFVLPTRTYLMVGPVLFYLTMGGLGLWTAWSRRRAEKKL